MRARTNLASPASSFVGREAELAALEELFEEARLVTVLGPGGMGKSRLAMRYGAERLDAYAASEGGGVWLVELAGLASDAAVAEAIGRRIARLGRVLLVLDGSTGQNAIEQARQFTAATEVSGLVLTKLDGTARGGVVIGIAEEFNIPVRFIGVGEQPEDLQVFNAMEFVDSLLPASFGDDTPTA